MRGSTRLTATMKVSGSELRPEQNDGNDGTSATDRERERRRIKQELTAKLVEVSEMPEEDGGERINGGRRAVADGEEGSIQAM